MTFQENLDIPGSTETDEETPFKPRKLSSPQPPITPLTIENEFPRVEYLPTLNEFLEQDNTKAIEKISYDSSKQGSHENRTGNESEEKELFSSDSNESETAGSEPVNKMGLRVGAKNR